MTKPSAHAVNPDTAIAFQGFPGAYSDLACREAYPALEPLPCPSFEDTFAAVKDGRARLAMIPIDNSVAGRVADIHHLLPQSGLHIVGEHFQRVQHHLLAVKGATIKGIREVHSHVHALGQCRKLIAELGVKPVVVGDTAGAAADLARRNDPTVAAIASELAGRTYGLVSLRSRTRARTMARSSPASCSACAACRPRSTRRSAASPPTASTSPSWKAT
jgi:prephenate dehydratase